MEYFCRRDIYDTSIHDVNMKNILVSTMVIDVYCCCSSFSQRMKLNTGIR
jgi:hypothetical protein